MGPKKAQTTGGGPEIKMVWVGNPMGREALGRKAPQCFAKGEI